MRTPLEEARIVADDAIKMAITDEYSKARIQQAQALALIAIAEVLERMYKWDRA